MRRVSYLFFTGGLYLGQNLVHILPFFMGLFSQGLDLFLKKLYLALVITNSILEGGNILSLKAQLSLQTDYSSCELENVLIPQLVNGSASFGRTGVNPLEDELARPLWKAGIT